MELLPFGNKLFIWRYFGEFLIISWSKFNFSQIIILRKMTYTGSREAVFPSWCQDGFKMPLPQVDDDHVSKWRASRWRSYLNMFKLSGLQRTTSSCHVSIKACGTNPLCVISRRKRCGVKVKVGIMDSAFLLRYSNEHDYNVKKIAHPRKHETLKSE